MIPAACSRPIVLTLALALGIAGFAVAQPGTAPPTQGSAPPPAATPPLDVAACLAEGVGLLVRMQESLASPEGKGEGEGEGEGDAMAAAPAEWPYQGVYRVQGEIPIGYRVGGTAICGTALLAAPGWDADEPRRSAVHRAAEFVCRQTDHPLMQFPYPPSYDVRGWGYAYALDFLLRLEERGGLPPALAEAVPAAIDFYLQGLLATELESGGWNYALSPRRLQHAPFMTAPVLQSLFRAAARGREVPAEVFERGLAALEASRLDSGAMVYSGTAADRTDSLPGATGRMLTADATLMLAGRGDAERLRFAVAAFFEHWDELEKRRRRSGTHVPPHGVAPYYFFFAHHAAAQAIELLPEEERPALRTRLHERLARVREADGSWNDRVFERSANYGTAMTMLALAMSDGPPPPGWSAAGPPTAPAPSPATGPSSGSSP
jgi:hypothetical protein